MTAKVKTLVGGEYLDIEFYLDGSFEITNKDIEYEIAYEAMGGKGSPATWVLKEIEVHNIEWLLQEGAWHVKRDVLHIEGFDGVLAKNFAIDVVDHVSWIYAEYAKETYISYLISEARRTVSEGQVGVDPRAHLGRLVARMTSGNGSRKFPMYDWPSIREIKSAVYDMTCIIPLETPTRGPIMERVALIQRCVASAVADDASEKFSEDVQDKLFDEAWVKERDWQFRRLIHLLEAKQEGKPLPALLETP
jgi:hypothetical protein